MNTPSPCNKCKHLYVDAMYEDEPDYKPECKATLDNTDEEKPLFGDDNCPSYENWESKTP